MNLMGGTFAGGNGIPGVRHFVYLFAPNMAGVTEIGGDAYDLPNLLARQGIVEDFFFPTKVGAAPTGGTRC
jgi:hypothetical protein